MKTLPVDTGYAKQQLMVFTAIVLRTTWAYTVKQVRSFVFLLVINTINSCIKTSASVEGFVIIVGLK